MRPRSLALLLPRLSRLALFALLTAACGSSDALPPPAEGGAAGGGASGGNQAGQAGGAGAGGSAGGGGAQGCATVAGMAPVADVRCGDVLDAPALVGLFASPTTIDTESRPECTFGFADGTAGGVYVYCGEAPFGTLLDGAHKPSGAVVDEGVAVGSEAFSATSDSKERRVVFVSTSKKYTAAVRLSGPKASAEAALSLAQSVDQKLGELP